MKIKFYFFLLLFVALFLNCATVTVPEEAKKAYSDLNKLKIASETGTDPMNYNRLLIEAKSSAENAYIKLPTVTKEISDDYYPDYTADDRLMVLNDSLQKGVQAYDDARTIALISLETTEIYYTENGNRIMKKYNISKDITDAKTIINEVWLRGWKYTMKASFCIKD